MRAKPPTADELVRTIAIQTAKARIDELLEHVPIEILPEVVRFIEAQIKVQAQAAA